MLFFWLSVILGTPVPVNAVVEKESSELIAAVKLGDKTRISALVQKEGFDINFRSKPEGMSALHRAIEANQLGIAKLLLKHHADPNTVDEKGNTLLHTAVNTYSRDAITFLLDEVGLEPKPNLLNEWPIHRAIDAGEITLVQKFVDHGQNINVPGEQGRSPLFLAAVRNRVRLIKPLLNLGADINQFDNLGLTPLMAAGSIKMCDLLIKLGADVNAQREGGPHCLALALRNQEFEQAKWLLSKGANPDAQYPKGWPAMSYAKIYHNEAIENLLLSRGASPFNPFDFDSAPLFFASSGQLNDLEAYLKSKPNALNMTDRWGNTLLIAAAKHNRLDCVKFLLERGMDVKAKGEMGMTALMHATVNRNLDMIRLLLAQKQDLMLQNDQGKSVYYLAQSAESPNHVIDILVQAGARRNPKEGCGCN